VTADDRDICGFALWQFKPWEKSLWAGIDPFFAGKFHFARRRCESQARQGVYDDSQAVGSAQAWAPGIRQVSIHARQKFTPIRASEFRFDFAGQGNRFACTPSW
jgi:hypothetical protein